MGPERARVAVVTGASAGIGAASARALAAAGFQCVLGARRLDWVQRLAAELGGGAAARPLDVSEPASVAEFVRDLGVVDLLVNNAGGARGLDPVAAGDDEQWRWMWEVNVLGLVRMTRALLPALEASGHGHIINVGSVAGTEVYEGGGGYTSAKHAVRAVTQTLRLELAGRPVRVSEVAPGMVRTEFSANRFDGDEARAAGVYAGVEAPLTAADIADCIAWVATRPPHVNIDHLVVRPLAQAAAHRVHRTT